jgi:hypothetical protein
MLAAWNSGIDAFVEMLAPEPRAGCWAAGRRSCTRAV